MAEQPQTAELDARFAALVEEYGSLLRGAIAQHCPRDLGIQIDDVEQEARIRLWRALQREREIRDPASYLYRIAVTTTIDAVRRVIARREEQLRVRGEWGDDEGPAVALAAGPEASPERAAELDRVMARVEAAIGRLAENRRLAVRLHLQGLTSDEIGDLLGWTEPKARNLVSRGMRDLREALAAEGIDYEA